MTGLSHQPRVDGDGGRGNGRRAGRARLPRSALPDEHGQVVRGRRRGRAGRSCARGSAGASRSAGRGGGGRRGSGRRAGPRRAGCRPTPSSARCPSTSLRLADGHLPDLRVRIERVRASAPRPARPAVSIVTSVAPVSAASQRAAMRDTVAGHLGRRAVGVPDRDHGVRRRRAASTSRTPSEPMPVVDGAEPLHACPASAARRRAARRRGSCCRARAISRTAWREDVAAVADLPARGRPVRARLVHGRVDTRPGIRRIHLRW